MTSTSYLCHTIIALLRVLTIYIYQIYNALSAECPHFIILSVTKVGFLHTIYNRNYVTTRNYIVIYVSRVRLKLLVELFLCYTQYSGYTPVHGGCMQTLQTNVILYRTLYYNVWHASHLNEKPFFNARSRSKS